MSSIVISGDTSGSITLASPAVAGSNTVTMPAASGVCMVSGNMPAFSVYQSSAQTLSNGVSSKLQFQTKEFDTNNNFDNATNYRFTPTVAGYYQINGGWQPSTGSTVNLSVNLYKNGSAYKQGPYVTANLSNSNYNVSSVVYCNGSTDYLELYAYNNSGGSVVVVNSIPATYFNGVLVRTA
jgi:hypothetical protein